jgi:predicted TIM-barrel fold metal-dependent hydrolase
MIVDFEHHYFPEELFIKYGGKPGEVVVLYQNGIPQVSLNDKLYLLDEHLRFMDESGIDMAVLSTTGLLNDLEDCRLINNSLAKLMKEHATRFVGLAQVLPLGGKEAFGELDRAINTLGLKGVNIRSQINGQSLDSPELWPFFEKVSRLGVPVFVHVAPAPQGYDALKLSYFDLYRSIGREFDLANATARLILSGVLERFPDLKIIMAHFGGGIAALRERIDIWGKLDHWSDPAEMAKRISRPFTWYLEKMYFDLAGYTGGMNALKCALTTVSPKHLLFATDYPQPLRSDVPHLMRDYIENIKKLDLDEESKRSILGGNAVKLLGL